MPAHDDIRFEVKGGVGRVTLDRPQALNAVTLEMLRALDDRLLAWADDDRVRAVVIGGEGRAFAAGGDIRRLWEAGRAGDPYTEIFFWDEYVVDWRVFHCPKPYVALMNGIVMGGGVGLSVLGSHRVVTENTQFAMPETGIGFFPDVGATYFLPRLPGRLGLYLALTGSRFGGADCLAAGIGTRYVPSERLPALEAELTSGRLPADDIEADHAAVTAILDRFSENPGAAPIMALRPAIDRCFSQESVEAVLDALRREGSEWAARTAATIEKHSPTALKVAFEQIRRGAGLSLDEALAVEFRLSQVFMAGEDFYEGVRATIIDKDGTPAWCPATLAEVAPEAVAACFEPRPREPDFANPRRRDQPPA